MLGRFLCTLLTSIFRLSRTSVVVICFGLFASGLSHCPTGQSGCAMSGMDDKTIDGALCILACGVPLEHDEIIATIFVGETSTAHVQPLMGLTGIVIEPVVPPPRRLV